MEKEHLREIIRLAATVLLLIILSITGPEGILRAVLYIVLYLFIGWDTVLEAFEGLFHGELTDEDLLMAVATIGATAIGEFPEAVTVMLLFKIGELFEDYGVERSRRSIKKLLDVRPDTVRLEEDGRSFRVAPQEAKVGSVMIVLPGERIAIDGTVTEGSSMLDTAALTGESVPRSASVGDEVLSGCINLSGVLRVRTTKPFGESTASRILELVENASASKARTENFVSSFAHIYTPVVCIAALFLAFVPPLFRSLVLGTEPLWRDCVYMALSFLVTSCPCAFVISIPLTFFAGIGGAGRSGVLVKGSEHLETLARVSTVVFDKTGTLTEGVFEVTRIFAVGISEKEFLRLAAAAEKASSHPIGRSIVRAASKTTVTGCAGSETPVTDVNELRGMGVSAKVEGHSLLVGNKLLMLKYGITPADAAEQGSVVHMAVDGSYAGYLVVSDRIRQGSASAVSELKSLGVRELVMLTGDREGAAAAVAEELGIDTVLSELLPEGKVEKLEEIIGRVREAGGKTAFVGDGMNDAPAISLADVGAAMGALGSDAAIEAADVVITDDDPRKFAAAVRSAKRTLRIARENVIFSIGTKLVCLGLIVFGLAGMRAAVAADVGVMVAAVLNALRALKRTVPSQIHE